MHFATRVHKRLGAELRGQERGAKEIEVAAAQIGEALREIGCRVPGLEIRRGQIAEHRVVAGTIGIVERQQGRADQVKRLARIDRWSRLSRLFSAAVSGESSLAGCFLCLGSVLLGRRDG